MPNKKKKWPGRPSKAFIPAPKTKHEGPGRPKKLTPAYAIPRSRGVRGFIVSNILEAPKKDNIILLLFVLSLMIFLFSLYVTMIRHQKSLEAMDQTNDTNVTIDDISNVQSGNIPYEGLSTAQIENPAQEVLTNFYKALYQQDTKTMASLADEHLRNANMYQTYYTKHWLSLVIPHLSAEIQIKDLQIAPRAGNPEIQEAKYVLYYPLANGTSMTEDRSAVLLLKNDTYKIGRLMCEMTGCSKGVFFNPEKYK